MSLFSRLKQKIHNLRNNSIISKNHEYTDGLKKSRDKISNDLLNLDFSNFSNENELLENIEEMLITSDINFKLVDKIITNIKSKINKKNINNSSEIKEIIIEELLKSYGYGQENNVSLDLKKDKTNIILIVGVNGSGKTTSAAKLAKIFLDQNKTVVVAAGDTFRAGAVEQLNKWANLLSIKCISPKNNKQDSASVIYDATEYALENKIDVLICDTAGRLQNKENLMNELSKIKRIIDKKRPYASSETLLVLDATTGQNGINQAKSFQISADVDGIILTKMDGTSKGGIIMGIKDNFNIPVKFIGLGEKISDFKKFDLDEYIINLFKGLV